MDLQLSRLWSSPSLSVILSCTHRTFSLYDPEGTTAHGLSVPLPHFILGSDSASLRVIWIVRRPHNLFLPGNA